jgi:hypothetical protein
MAAGLYNLTVEQGVDLALEVAVKDGTGATYSLAGATAAAQTFGSRIAQRSATDASNPAIMSTGCYIKYTKIA